MNPKLDAKIHSTHAYMLMPRSWPSSLAHKLLTLMHVLNMLVSLVRTGLIGSQLQFVYQHEIMLSSSGVFGPFISFIRGLV